MKNGNDRQNQRGALLLFTAIGTLVLTIIVLGIQPLVSIEQRREQEQQLVFCLKAYQRALEKFYQVHRRYPVDLEELVKNKYLRKLYLDPITGNFDWIRIKTNSDWISEIRSSSDRISLKGPRYSQWYYNDDQLKFSPAPVEQH